MSTSQRHILIIENGHSAIETLTARLRADGHIVDIAASEREAVEKVARVRELFSRSPQMQHALQVARDAASFSNAVLIVGEPGSGRKTLARAIHEWSERATCPFISTCCASTQEALLASELFGHEAGAVPGAKVRKPGALELANTGTIYLNQIDELPLRLRMNLSRALEEGRFHRVGGSEEVHTDVRVIASVSPGGVDDLVRPLHPVQVELPALRERREDIENLAASFLDCCSQEGGRRIDGVTEGALKTLFDHNWPGNVRELENAIARAASTATGPKLTEDDFAFLGRTESGTTWAIPAGVSLASMEKVLISETLRRNRGNIKRSAAILGIDRSTLYEKIKKYEIPR